MDRTLYSGTKNASSWAFRAWLALREAEVTFVEEVVDIRRPQRFANLARVGEFSPPAAVPVLVEGDTVIFDSLAIMEYANELSGGRLLPVDPQRRARARSLLAWVHAGLSGLGSQVTFEDVFAPQSIPLDAALIADLQRIFTLWEGELAHSGGPWLAGSLSLADLAFAPTVIRLLSVNPDVTSWPLAADWCQRLIQRASVSEWMQEARTLPPVLDSD